MGADRIDNDGISARIIEQLVFKDEAARVGVLSDWTGAEKSKVSTRVHEVLEPKGLIEKAGTEELADPLNDANLWRLTEDGTEWALRNLDDVYEEIFDEKPGAIIVKLLHRTESVEHHMESVRGEFDSLSMQVEQLREDGVPAEAVERMGALEERVDDFEGRINGLDVAVRDLQDDVEELQQRFDRVIAEQY